MLHLMGTKTKIEYWSGHYFWGRLLTVWNNPYSPVTSTIFQKVYAQILRQPCHCFQGNFMVFKGGDKLWFLYCCTFIEDNKNTHSLSQSGFPQVGVFPGQFAKLSRVWNISCVVVIKILFIKLVNFSKCFLYNLFMRNQFVCNRNVHWVGY